MSTRCFRVLALAALLVGGSTVTSASSFVTAAHRARAHDYGVEIQAVLNRVGDPLLAANFSPDGSLATPHWSICPPDSQGPCTTAAAKDGVLQPGAEPAGTRFVASASYAGWGYSAAVA